jgi:hypothetical protein
VKLLALLLVLIVLVAITVLVSRAWRRWRESRAPWEIVEESDGEGVRVLARRPDDDDLLIGYVPFGLQVRLANG